MPARQPVTNRTCRYRYGYVEVDDAKRAAAVPPTRVFWEKRLQTIENKGSECRNEWKERAKRRQADADKRVGKFESLKVDRWERLGKPPW